MTHAPEGGPAVNAVGVLGFSDRRSAGSYPVLDAQGRTVALLKVAFWTASSFEAYGADGALILRAQRRTLSRTWDGVDASGTIVASVRTAFWTNGAIVTLPSGRMLKLRVQAFSRAWTLHDEDGRTVLTSTPSTGVFSWHPDTWEVRCDDDRLELACVLLVVQCHRMRVKASRRAAAIS